LVTLVIALVYRLQAIIVLVYEMLLGKPLQAGKTA